MEQMTTVITMDRYNDEKYQINKDEEIESIVDKYTNDCDEIQEQVDNLNISKIRLQLLNDLLCNVVYIIFISYIFF